MYQNYKCRGRKARRGFGGKLTKHIAGHFFYKGKCDDCKALYKIRQEKGLEDWDWEPPCASCWPELLQENRDIAKVFFFAINHRRYEQGQYIGLDMNFVVKLMEMLQVQNKERCLSAIIKISDEQLRKK